MVKIDIEGYEPVALEGMRAIIHKHKPIIISEFHPRLIREVSQRDPEAYLHALAACGYALAVIGRDDRLYPCDGPAAVMARWQAVNQQHHSDGLIHLDILAIPEGAEMPT